MNQTVVGSILGRSSIKIAHFVPIPLTNMATTCHSCFMLLTKFRFIWLCRFSGEDFKKSTNQKQELLVAAMFVN
jgi:hypothetical protein